MEEDVTAPHNTALGASMASQKAPARGGELAEVDYCR